MGVLGIDDGEKCTGQGGRNRKRGMIKWLGGSYNRNLFPRDDKCLFKLGVIPGEEILMY